MKPSLLQVIKTWIDFFLFTLIIAHNGPALALGKMNAMTPTVYVKLH